MNELKIFGLKLVVLLLITPLIGFLFLRVAEDFEKEWKSGIRRKRWLAMCGLFFMIAVIGGWLR